MRALRRAVSTTEGQLRQFDMRPGADPIARRWPRRPLEVSRGSRMCLRGSSAAADVAPQRSLPLDVWSGDALDRRVAVGGDLCRGRRIAAVQSGGGEVQVHQSIARMACRESMQMPQRLLVASLAVVDDHEHEGGVGRRSPLILAAAVSSN